MQNSSATAQSPLHGRDRADSLFFRRSGDRFCARFFEFACFLRSALTAVIPVCVLLVAVFAVQAVVLTSEAQAQAHSAYDLSLIAEVQETSPDLATVQYLLAEGARAELTLTDGTPLLFDAANRGHAEVVSVLVTAGANVNLTVSKGGGSGNFPYYVLLSSPLDGGAANTFDLTWLQALSVIVHFGDAVKIAALTSAVRFDWAAQNAASNTPYISRINLRNTDTLHPSELNDPAKADIRGVLRALAGYIADQGVACNVAALCTRPTCPVTDGKIYSCSACAGYSNREIGGNACAAQCNGIEVAESTVWGENQCVCPGGGVLDALGCTSQANSELLLAEVEKTPPNLATVQYLLANGARAQLTLANGIPLLFAAAIRGHAKMVSVLVTAGANVNQKVQIPDQSTAYDFPYNVIISAPKANEAPTDITWLQALSVMVYFGDAVKIAAATSTVRFDWPAGDAAAPHLYRSRIAINTIPLFRATALADRSRDDERAVINALRGYLADQGASCGSVCDVARPTCPETSERMYSCTVCAGYSYRQSDGDACATQCRVTEIVHTTPWGETRCTCPEGEIRDALGCASEDASVLLLAEVEKSPSNPPNLATVQYLLSLGGARATITNSAGKTPLLIAVEKGYSEVAGALLSSGQNANGMDLSGIPLLIRAGELGHAKVVSVLITAGANPNVTRAHGNSGQRTLPYIVSYNGNYPGARGLDSWPAIAEVIVHFGDALEVAGNYSYDWGQLSVYQSNPAQNIFTELNLWNTAYYNGPGQNERSFFIHHPSQLPSERDKEIIRSIVGYLRDKGLECPSAVSADLKCDNNENRRRCNPLDYPVWTYSCSVCGDDTHVEINKDPTRSECAAGCDANQVEQFVWPDLRCVCASGSPDAQGQCPGPLDPQLAAEIRKDKPELDTVIDLLDRGANPRFIPSVEQYPIVVIAAEKMHARVVSVLITAGAWPLATSGSSPDISKRRHNLIPLRYYNENGELSNNPEALQRVVEAIIAFGNAVDAATLTSSASRSAFPWSSDANNFGDIYNHIFADYQAATIAATSERVREMLGILAGYINDRGGLCDHFIHSGLFPEEHQALCRSNPTCPTGGAFYSCSDCAGYSLRAPEGDVCVSQCGIVETTRERFWGETECRCLSGQPDAFGCPSPRDPALIREVEKTSPNLGVIRFLLDRGARPVVTVASGRPLVMEAALRRHAGVVSVLITAGVDANTRHNNRTLPQALIAAPGNDASKVNVLIHFADAVKVAGLTSTASYDWHGGATAATDSLYHNLAARERNAEADKEALRVMGAYIQSLTGTCLSDEKFRHLCINAARVCSPSSRVYSCSLCAENPIRSFDGDSCVQACGDANQALGEPNDWGETQCQCALDGILQGREECPTARDFALIEEIQSPTPDLAVVRAQLELGARFDLTLANGDPLIFAAAERGHAAIVSILVTVGVDPYMRYELVAFHGSNFTVSFPERYAGRLINRELSQYNLIKHWGDAALLRTGAETLDWAAVNSDGIFDDMFNEILYASVGGWVRETLSGIAAYMIDTGAICPAGIASAGANGALLCDSRRSCPSDANSLSHDCTACAGAPFLSISGDTCLARCEDGQTAGATSIRGEVQCRQCGEGDSCVYVPEPRRIIVEVENEGRYTLLVNGEPASSGAELPLPQARVQITVIANPGHYLSSWSGLCATVSFDPGKSENVCDVSVDAESLFGDTTVSLIFMERFLPFGVPVFGPIPDRVNTQIGGKSELDYYCELLGGVSGETPAGVKICSIAGVRCDSSDAGDAGIEDCGGSLGLFAHTRDCNARGRWDVNVPECNRTCQTNHVARGGSCIPATFEEQCAAVSCAAGAFCTDPDPYSVQPNSALCSCRAGPAAGDGFSSCQSDADASARLLAEVQNRPGHASILNVRRLLAEKPNLNHADADGAPLLIVAATIGHAEIVSVLITAGADPEATARKSGLDLVQYLAGALSNGAATSRAARADVLYRFGDALAARGGSFDWNRASPGGPRALDILLDEAAAESGISDADKAVIQRMANYMRASGRDARCSSAASSFTNGICQGVDSLLLAEVQKARGMVNMTAVTEALERGANPNSTDGDNRPLLIVAATVGHVELLGVLISAGASVNARDPNFANAGRTNYGVAHYLAAAPALTNGPGALQVSLLYAFGEAAGAAYDWNGTYDSPSGSYKRAMDILSTWAGSANADQNVVVEMAAYMRSRKGECTNTAAQMASVCMAGEATRMSLAAEIEKSDADVSAVLTLLSQSAGWANSENDAGVPLLIVAATTGHAEIVSVLITAGADAEAVHPSLSNRAVPHLMAVFKSPSWATGLDVLRHFADAVNQTGAAYTWNRLDDNEWRALEHLFSRYDNDSLVADGESVAEKKKAMEKMADIFLENGEECREISKVTWAEHITCQGSLRKALADAVAAGTSSAEEVRAAAQTVVAAGLRPDAVKADGSGNSGGHVVGIAGATGQLAAMSILIELGADPGGKTANDRAVLHHVGTGSDVPANALNLLRHFLLALEAAGKADSFDGWNAAGGVGRPLDAVVGNAQDQEGEGEREIQALLYERGARCANANSPDAYCMPPAVNFELPDPDVTGGLVTMAARDYAGAVFDFELPDREKAAHMAANGLALTIERTTRPHRAILSRTSARSDGRALDLTVNMVRRGGTETVREFRFTAPFQASLLAEVRNPRNQADASAVAALLAQNGGAKMKDSGGTPLLIIAATLGHAQIVSVLITAGADANARDGDGAAVPHIAASNNFDGGGASLHYSWATARDVLRHFSDAVSQSGAAYDWTATRGGFQAVELLEARYSGAQATRAGESEEIKRAAMEEMADILLGHGGFCLQTRAWIAHVTCQGRLRQTLLDAIVSGASGEDVRAAAQAVADAGYSPDWLAPDGGAIVAVAAASLHAEAVSVLIGFGYDPAGKTANGRSALHHAARNAGDNAPEALRVLRHFLAGLGAENKADAYDGWNENSDLGIPLEIMNRAAERVSGDWAEKSGIHALLYERGARCAQPGNKSYCRAPVSRIVPPRPAADFVGDALTIAARDFGGAVFELDDLTAKTRAAMQGRGWRAELSADRPRRIVVARTRVSVMGDLPVEFTVTMRNQRGEAVHTFLAVFSTPQPPKIFVESSGSGRPVILANGAPVESGAALAPGTNVLITVIPRTGHHFYEWGGRCAESGRVSVFIEPQNALQASCAFIVVNNDERVSLRFVPRILGDDIPVLGTVFGTVSIDADQAISRDCNVVNKPAIKRNTGEIVCSRDTTPPCGAGEFARETDCIPYASRLDQCVAVDNPCDEDTTCEDKDFYKDESLEVVCTCPGFGTHDNCSLIDSNKALMAEIHKPRGVASASVVLSIIHAAEFLNLNHYRDEHDSTALLAAALRGHGEIMSVLITFGVDPGTRQNSGYYTYNVLNLLAFAPSGIFNGAVADMPVRMRASLFYTFGDALATRKAAGTGNFDDLWNKENNIDRGTPRLRRGNPRFGVYYSYSVTPNDRRAVDYPIYVEMANYLQARGAECYSFGLTDGSSQSRRNTILGSQVCRNRVVVSNLTMSLVLEIRKSVGEARASVVADLMSIPRIANPNYAFPNGRSALIVATRRGHAGIISVLVTAGANARVRDGDYNNYNVVHHVVAPLQPTGAAFGDYALRASVLYHFGAAVEERERAVGGGFSAFDWNQSANTRNENFGRPLDVLALDALTVGAPEADKTILNEMADYLIAKGSRCSLEAALTLAVCVKAAGEDPPPDEEEEGGEEMEMRVDRVSLIRASLLAEVQKPLDAADPVDAANPDVVVDLLNQGGSPNGLDAAGDLLLVVAATMGHAEIVSILVTAGADWDARTQRVWRVREITPNERVAHIATSNNLGQYRNSVFYSWETASKVLRHFHDATRQVGADFPWTLPIYDYHFSSPAIPNINPGYASNPLERLRFSWLLMTSTTRTGRGADESVDEAREHMLDMGELLLGYGNRCRGSYVTNASKRDVVYKKVYLPVCMGRLGTALGNLAGRTDPVSAAEARAAAQAMVDAGLDPNIAGVETGATRTSDGQNSSGHALIPAMAMRGHAEAMSVLMTFDADPNGLSEEGKTALHIMAENSATDAAEQLRLLRAFLTGLGAAGKTDSFDGWNTPVAQSESHTRNPRIPADKNYIPGPGPLDVLNTYAQRSSDGLAEKREMQRLLYERGARCETPGNRPYCQMPTEDVILPFDGPQTGDLLTLTAGDFGGTSFEFLPIDAAMEAELNAGGWRFSHYNGPPRRMVLSRDSGTGAPDALLPSFSVTMLGLGAEPARIFHVSPEVAVSVVVEPIPVFGGVVRVAGQKRDGAADEGATLTFEAIPNPGGWTIAAWGGDGEVCFAKENRCELIAESDLLVQVRFDAPLVTVAGAAVPSAGGNVTILGGLFEEVEGDMALAGMQVTFGATPEPGWEVFAWQGDGKDCLASSLECTTTVVAGGGLFVTARFARVSRVRHSVAPDESGGVLTVSGLSRDDFVFSGGTVTFTATPASGWTLAAWEGDGAGCAWSDLECARPTSAGNDLSVVARFAPVSRVTHSIISPEGGTLTVSGLIEEGVAFSDAIVTFTALPEPGWALAAWQGDGGAAGCGQSDLKCALAADGGLFVTVRFAPVGRVGPVSVFPLSGGGATLAGMWLIDEDDVGFAGATVTFTAIPEAGWTLASWQGDAGHCAASALECAATLTAEKPLLVTMFFDINCGIVNRVKTAGTIGECGACIEGFKQVGNGGPCLNFGAPVDPGDPTGPTDPSDPMDPMDPEDSSNVIGDIPQAILCRALRGDPPGAPLEGDGTVCSGVDANDTFCILNSKDAFPCRGLFNHVLTCNNKHGRQALNPFFCGRVCNVQGEGDAVGGKCMR